VVIYGYLKSVEHEDRDRYLIYPAGEVLYRVML
jgi:hypothetical protein